MVLLNCILVSCWESKEVEIGEFVGTYTFTYPSGEVEVLLISADSTYRKNIYSTFSDFEKRSVPKYTNTGRWLVVKRNELEFDNWLMYNNHLDPHSILSVPYYATMLNIYWIKEYGKRPKILIYDETDYIFQKIE
jgi:hypothetical protein